MAVTPWGIYSGDINELAKTWARTYEKVWKSNSSPADWRMWLPRAVWLNWSDPNTWQTRVFDPSIWLPLAFSSPEERERVKTIWNIAGDYVVGEKAGGDMFRDISDATIANKAKVKNTNIENQ